MHVYEQGQADRIAADANTQVQPTQPAQSRTALLLKLVKEVSQELLDANELLERGHFSTQEVAEVKAKGEADIEAFKKNKR